MAGESLERSTIINPKLYPLARDDTKLLRTCRALGHLCALFLPLVFLKKTKKLLQKINPTVVSFIMSTIPKGFFRLTKTQSLLLAR